MVVAVRLASVLALGGAALAQRQPRALPVFSGVYGEGLDEHARFGCELGARRADHRRRRRERAARAAWVRSATRPPRACTPRRGVHDAAFLAYMAELRAPTARKCR